MQITDSQVIAILVSKLGGHVNITREDMQSYHQIQLTKEVDGSITIKTQSSVVPSKEDPCKS